MNKVFGIGLSRTGTASLTAALSMLGYRACHFPHDLFVDVQKYDALTDTPVAANYRRLMKLYPNAKFILTVRDRASWLDSCQTLWATQSARFSEEVNRIHWTIYRTEKFDRRLFAAAYESHRSEAIWLLAETGRLLVMDICAGEGWRTLCNFLNKARIPNQPFPHENDRTTLYTNNEWQRVYEPVKA